MEWRVATRAGLRSLLVNGSRHRKVMWRGVSVIPTNRPADTAVHSGELEEGSNEGETSNAEASDSQRNNKSVHKIDPLVPPKPLSSPSAKLESTLNQPINPTTQQKRHGTTTAPERSTLADVACVGIDGWEDEEEKGMGRQRKEQEEDDKEYFKHNKASPLSEIEVADTRKPFTRATDGTADSYGRGEDVILFSDEQRDTAEDSLRRATDIWRENAMRGDPDSPHGRVLRALRGENW